MSNDVVISQWPRFTDYKKVTIYIFLVVDILLWKGEIKEREDLIKTKAKLRLENKSRIIRWGNEKEYTMF